MNSRACHELIQNRPSDITMEPLALRNRTGKPPTQMFSRLCHAFLPQTGGNGLSKREANGAGGSSQVKTLSQVLPLQSVRDIIVKA